MTATASAVRCRGITKSFAAGNETVSVLNGIDLDLRGGELSMLVGPSGCGKTTLISIIAGILSPSGGEVEIAGQSLAGMSDDAKVAFRRNHVGFIFQQYNLLPPLTAVENAAIPLVAAGLSMRQATARAAGLLARVGMAEHLAKLPNQLSGGQQQRVAIVRALVHEPQLIVCDEPTAALDADTGQAVLEILKDAVLAADRAVVVVTHDTRIYGFADRMAVMEDGRITSVGDAPPATSRERHRHEHH